MPDWTCGEEFWRRHHYGESRDDALAPDHGLAPTCEACETELADLEVRGQLLCVACADDVRVGGSQATPVPPTGDPAATPGNVNTPARI